MTVFAFRKAIYGKLRCNYKMLSMNLFAMYHGAMPTEGGNIRGKEITMGALENIWAAGLATQLCRLDRLWTQFLSRVQGIDQFMQVIPRQLQSDVISWQLSMALSDGPQKLFGSGTQLLQGRREIMMQKCLKVVVPCAKSVITCNLSQHLVHLFL
jgi:hypothetical protein